jgi:aldose 1-epimerase
MNLAGRKYRQRKPTGGGTHFSTRGWVTPSIVGLLCLALVVASYERGHGNLHKIKSRVNPPPPTEVIALGPGGQDPVRLSRSPTTIGKEAELISATFLPGRGMNVFQITALIPGHGEVPLLVSPPLASAPGVLNGQDEDANGSASTTLGAAILAPWAQSLTGQPTASPGILQTAWNGRRLTFPAVNARSSQSVEGLLLNRGADGVKSDVLPDGQSVTAVFHAGDFGGSWPSTIDITVQADLTSKDLDLTVTAKNVGQQPAPFGVGWQPFFAIPSGDRSDALLRIPSKIVTDTDLKTGLPTGKMSLVDGTPRDFDHAGGMKLGTNSVDGTYTNLEPGLDSGPIAAISDPGYNVRMSVIPLTANVTNMRVLAPADKPWVSIGPNTNLNDPFGPQWGNPENAGMMILAPGATFRWKVRLEISLIGTTESTM